MTPNFTTIIATIRNERVDALEQYLRDEVEPQGLDMATGTLLCRPAFPFHEIKGLQFCSFVILEGDAEFPPCLVFEATFDGERDDFLQDLLRAAPEGVHTIFANCVGYPKSGMTVGKLVTGYLIANDVGASLMFRGSPGRSSAQIDGESRIRKEVVSFLAGRRQAGPLPVGLDDLQQEIQREVVRGRPENRWAEAVALVPWEISARTWIATGAALALLTAATLLGVLVLRIWKGWSPGFIADHINSATQYVIDLAVALANSNWPLLSQISSVIVAQHMSAVSALFVLSLAWLVLRALEYVMRTLTDSPREQFFVLRYPLHIFVILRYAVLAALIGFAGLTLVEKAKAPAPGLAQDASPITRAIAKLDRNLILRGSTDRALPDAVTVTVPVVVPAWLASLLLLAGLGAVWLLFNHWATSLKLAVQYQQLPAKAENIRRLLLDAARFAKVVLGVLMALVVARHMPVQVQSALADLFTPVIDVLLTLGCLLLAGVLSFYGLVLVPFLVIRSLELRDRKRYLDPEQLIGRQAETAHAYAREECGTNRYQNHLVSLTHVKGGVIRRWLLRSTLLVIGLLARFWFNRGELGGIPTILSARWVLIDGGRRLLFLDHYSGAWESYLNEFIDMGAVKGLNAIWTNTFVKTVNPEQRFTFPETRFYVWQGAQAERPFKAYVRRSQIETLVWYSAHPTLSIKNINTNTDIRQALFKPAAPCGLDGMFQHL